jgi:hypothetical protein
MSCRVRAWLNSIIEATVLHGCGNIDLSVGIGVTPYVARGFPGTSGKSGTWQRMPVRGVPLRLRGSVEDEMKVVAALAMIAAVLVGSAAQAAQDPAKCAARCKAYCDKNYRGSSFCPNQCQTKNCR